MRPPLLLVALVVAALSTGCDSAGPVRGSLGGGSAQFDLDGYGPDWAGMFAGAGRGVVGSMNVDVHDARLTIELDPDSVRLNACRGCVTITLDTLFWRPNVFLSDPQNVVVRYEEDGVRRSLGLELFSGGGGTANVVQASLRIEDAAGGGLLADLTYVMER